MLATTIILVVAIVAFCTNRLPPALVALCVVIALYLTGSVDLQGALSGFADPVFVYLAGLFVVAEALELTGLTAWAGQQLTRTVGDRRSRVLVALMLLFAVLTALVSTNAAVATLIPVGVRLATRTGQSPSLLLIPITFAAQAGAMLTLLGRPVNLIASEMALDAGARTRSQFGRGDHPALVVA